MILEGKRASRGFWKKDNMNIVIQLSTLQVYTNERHAKPAMYTFLCALEAFGIIIVIYIMY